MYTAGKRSRRSKRTIIIAIVLLVAGIWGYQAYQRFQSETETVIQNRSGTTRKVEIPSEKVTRFEETTFAFELPSDWKKLKSVGGQYNKFSYQSTLKNADNRYLDVYVDAIPLTLAVNKAVAVRSTGAKLTHGAASDNCLTFTPAQVGGQKAMTMPARWDGVEFICDTDNTSRNVIGTSSPETVNQVVLTGAATGPHKFFFTYTDNNYSPDYSIFYKMLNSFSAQ